MIAKVNRPAVNGADQGLVKRTVVQDTSRKVCGRCGEEKSLNLFASDRTRPGGRRSTCKQCRDEYDNRRSYTLRCVGYGVDEPVVEPFSRQDVAERYGDACFSCVPGAFECIAHVIPAGAGGPHTLSNVRPSCRSCNSVKYCVADKPLIHYYLRSVQLVGASK
jgi:hypothetical protein